MPRYVVLEHEWGGVHFDLMLERGESLATWAIDRPIVFGVELPARSLSAHRLAYLEYEGPVSGGRGTVRRIDAGTYKARSWAPDRVVVELSGGSLAGIVELRRSLSGGAEGWTARFGKAD